MKSNTKIKWYPLYFIFFFLSNSLLAQKQTSHYKSEIDFGGGTIISTFLDISFFNNRFAIASPKNADIRMVGLMKAKVGRLFGKLPKNGIIITINGIQKGDSLFGVTTIPMFGKLTFKGVLEKNPSVSVLPMLSGKLFNAEGNPLGTISGMQSSEQKIDYTGYYPKILKTIEDNIYSRSVLQTKGWSTFNKKLEKLCKEANDDIELFFGFNMLAQELPFSHLSLMITNETAATEETEGEVSSDNLPKSVIFKEENTTTAYLQIRNFSSSESELLEVLPRILAKPAYKNLIIDLRNNGGGGVGAAFALAKYIVTEDMEVGYFPTNKLDYSGFQPEIFRNLASLQPKSTDDFGKELKSSPGVKLIFRKPSNPVFSGSMYVLTNNATGSTCEPIIYALKSSGKAIVIGQKTAGAMLSASPFVISGKYMLILPIADFYTHDGVRLDQIGVSPNIEVHSDDALTTALQIIQKKEKMEIN